MSQLKVVALKDLKAPMSPACDYEVWYQDLKLGTIHRIGRGSRCNWNASIFDSHAHGKDRDVPDRLIVKHAKQGEPTRDSAMRAVFEFFYWSLQQRKDFEFESALKDEKYALGSRVQHLNTQLSRLDGHLTPEGVFVTRIARENATAARALIAQARDLLEAAGKA